MKQIRALLPMLLFFVVLFAAGCGPGSPSQKPETLQVVRTENRNPGTAGTTRTWTITDAQAVQQLFDEVQGLPVHQNHGADSCAEPRYSYTLNFLVGKKSLQNDALYHYCFTLMLPDGSLHDPTDTFDSQFAGMLHVSTQELRGL